ncbi:MAG: hypothetical protein AAFY06_00205 [Pseudomonadota bacterium]
MAYTQRMPGFNVRKIEYSHPAFSRGMRALGQVNADRQAREERIKIGELLASGDARGAEDVAFKQGRVRFGMGLRGKREAKAAAAQAAEAKRIETARVAAEKERVFQQKQSAQQQKAAAAKAEKARKWVGKNLLSLNPQSPDFANQWSSRVAHLQKSGFQVPPEFSDPAVGYASVQADLLSPKDIAAGRPKPAAPPVPGPAEAGYGMDEEGNLVGTDQPLQRVLFKSPGGAPLVAGDEMTAQQAQAVRSQERNTAANRPIVEVDGRAYTRGGVDVGQVGQKSEEVPGVVVDTPDYRASRFATRKSEANQAINRASLDDQRRIKKVRDNQRIWTEVYGKKAPAGSIYNEKGDIVDLKDRFKGRTPSQTQRAALGAMSASLDTIKDVRESLRGTTVLSRGASQAANSGRFARASKLLRPAIRGVLHGMSGAQVNIPETKDYFDTFMPHWTDAQSTIEFKLNHLENMLTRIRGAINGKANEADVARLRGDIRKAIGLKDRRGAAPARAQPTPQRRSSGGGTVRSKYDGLGLE